MSTHAEAGEPVRPACRGAFAQRGHGGGGVSYLMTDVDGPRPAPCPLARLTASIEGGDRLPEATASPWVWLGAPRRHGLGGAAAAAPPVGERDSAHDGAGWLPRPDAPAAPRLVGASGDQPLFPSRTPVAGRPDRPSGLGPKWRFAGLSASGSLVGSAAVHEPTARYRRGRAPTTVKSRWQRRFLWPTPADDDHVAGGVPWSRHPSSPPILTWRFCRSLLERGDLRRGGVYCGGHVRRVAVHPAPADQPLPGRGRGSLTAVEVSPDRGPIDQRGRSAVVRDRSVVAKAPGVDLSRLGHRPLRSVRYRS